MVTLGRRKALPNSVVEKIAPLYKTLLEIEKVKGEAASKLYFDAYLKEEIGKSYDEFVVDLFTDESMKNEKVAAEEAAKPKKGLSWFFSKN
ncbi:hypothetical protein PJW08_01750 [Tenacibaculum finnmarkense]|nr:hypothetical protein PJW08_01750 [Tenacibaculum finnmarkense]